MPNGVYDWVAPKSIQGAMCVRVAVIDDRIISLTTHRQMLTPASMCIGAYGDLLFPVAIEGRK